MWATVKSRKIKKTTQKNKKKRKEGKTDPRVTKLYIYIYIHTYIYMKCIFGFILRIFIICQFIFNICISVTHIRCYY